MNKTASVNSTWKFEIRLLNDFRLVAVLNRYKKQRQFEGTQKNKIICRKKFFCSPAQQKYNGLYL